MYTHQRHTSTSGDSAIPSASASQPHADWQIPARYQLRHLIGAGSYGHVCEAYDTVEHKVVAIKRIHRVFEDLVDCKRILREIAILNRLEHKNVVRTCDICVPADPANFDELYLVLEIADSDFKKLFKTPIYLTELHVIALLYNLLVGVKYIHSAGIYHRDLKPANCLVNQDCSVKICDFGLARTIDDSCALRPNGPRHHPVPHNPNREDKRRRASLPLSDDEKKENLYRPVTRMMNPQHPKHQLMKRQLTGHVVTRWYRAPELILLQEHYTEAIDVWSVGCIFAELLGMMKENVPSYVERSPLFPGSSCFPLSPDHKITSAAASSSSARYYKFHAKGNRDQLMIIFNILGTPSCEDIETLEKEDAKAYLRLFTPKQGINLHQRFPGASKEAIHLLARMLVFNPSHRINVDEALNSPLFQDVRCTASETVALNKVTLPFDDWKPMNEQQLRYAFLQEVRRFHPELKTPPHLMPDYTSPAAALHEPTKMDHSARTHNTAGTTQRSDTSVHRVSSVAST